MSDEKQDGAIAVARWRREECRIIRSLLDPVLTPAELDQVAIYCNHSGLEILIDQVYVTRFSGKLSIEPSIAGYRSVAARYPDYAGSGNPEWFTEDGEIHAVWLQREPPAGARVAVYRRGDERPTVGIARYASYVQTDKQGKPRAQWATMPEVMIAAAAERQALQKAFPLQHELAQMRRDVEPDEGRTLDGGET